MAGAPTGTVNFWQNPTAAMYPDQLVEQEKVDRQRALAQALQQMALEPIDAGKGSISPWQGVAKLAQALGAGLANRRTDKAQAAIYAHMAAPMRAAMGLPADPSAAPAPTSGTPNASPAPTLPPIKLSPETQAQLTPDAQAGLAAVNAAPPPNAPQTPPQQQAPQPAMPNLSALLANPQYQAIAFPDKVVEHNLAATLPTDVQKLVNARQAAAQQGDWATVQTLSDAIQKNNFIAPTNVREGGTAINSITGQPIFTSPHTPTGAVTTWGPDGRPAGMSMIPGATNAIAAAEGSKTAGQNANEPIAGYDAQGNPIFGSKLDAAHGGNANFRPAPPLGATAAADVTGKNSAQEFQAISDRASDVPNRIMALRQMQTLVNDPKTVLGPGSHSTAQVSGVLGTISQSMGIPFNPQVATNAAEFNKWASQYSARTAQELGLSGSDSRLALAVHASPNGQMTPQALKQMLPQFIGMENAKQGMGNAAVAWQQSHGAGTVQQFRAAWNANFDPRIYQWMAQGPQQFAANVKGLSPQEAGAVRHKYLTLKQMGALPQ